MRRSELRAKLRELQRDAVGDPAGLHGLPELPLRFPLRLSTTNDALVQQYIDLQTLPQLELSSDYELLWPDHGVLGRFSVRELAILRRLGPWYVIYTPRILELSPTGWVAIEMVRPLLNVCKQCQRVYPDGFTRCEKCRAPLSPERGVMPHVDFASLRNELRQADA